MAVLLALLAGVSGFWGTSGGENGAAKDRAEGTAVGSLARFDGPNALDELGDEHKRGLMWGTYKAGLYFGIKSRTFPGSFVSGLAWHAARKHDSARHECLEEHKMRKYGWTRHDGTTFGQQRIVDRGHRVVVDTFFLKTADGGGWVATADFGTGRKSKDSTRKKGSTSPRERTVVAYVYAGIDCDGSAESADSCLSKIGGIPITVDSTASNRATFSTKTRDLGELDGELVATYDNVHDKTYDDAANSAPAASQPIVSVQTLSRASFENIRDDALGIDWKGDSSMGGDEGAKKGAKTVVVMRIEGTLPMSIRWRVVPSAMQSPPNLDQAAIQADTRARAMTFDAHFDATFGLADKGYNPKQVRFARAALSNMLGGMGYFYGKSEVKRAAETGAASREGPASTYPMPLFTAVPSRSFFPRGFLWDEGFHQQLIANWNRNITLDVLAHWMGAVRSGGWIPREQILGAAARSRVPDQFVPQTEDVANPPTMALLVERLVATSSAKHDPILASVYPRLQRWTQWLLESQAGKIPGSFRWRGRDPNGDSLHPNTLASGLDDYPRATQPDETEYHVDMLSWAISMTRSMAALAEAVGEDAAARDYSAKSKRLLNGLDKLHWNQDLGLYCDVGRHSPGGVFEKRVVYRCGAAGGQTTDVAARPEDIQARRNPCPRSHPNPMYPLGDGHGGVLTREVFSPGDIKHGFVDQVGYVSLFPLFLKLLLPDSPRLAALFDALRDNTRLWSPWGLRSLSPNSRFYERANAPGDRPYWRGAIWMPINYLAVSALHHYAEVSGPYQDRARALYTELRENLVNNVFREYQRTGYLWEQYNSKTGRGQRSHPFTGWTALIVNIMAEKY